MQIASYGISFYFLFWVFWTSQDFPVSAYRWAFILISILIALSTVYFIKYKEVFLFRLQKIVNAMSRFIVIDAKEYIDETKIEEYNKSYFEALKKGTK